MFCNVILLKELNEPWYPLQFFFFGGDKKNISIFIKCHLWTMDHFFHFISTYWMFKRLKQLQFCLNGRTVIQAIGGNTALSHVKKLFLICQIPFLCLLHNFRIMFQKFCCSGDPQFEICIIQFFSGMCNFQCCQIPLKQCYTISSRLNRNFFLSARQLYNSIDLSGNQTFCCLSDGNCIVPFLFRLFHGLNG